ncbi:Aste57867_20171 [Aphanomyces stellatus]|uniref:Aste57867_20171 protein n=1 Tax=Aphanomyces stellatus TaxID=120398 RepID=A0A485LED2_9STRA|nr:hypothetical protein As57867_020105 [Aphanomyces stellatus]VFT96865.1 Aste57867_20171 [Aphanomyces stellatus]
MPKLFCVVVGHEGSPFPVDVAADETVGDLKKKIKEENKNTITCDAKDLELYLAKLGDAWLDSDGAKAVALDEYGKVPGFDVMDPTFSMKNPKCIGVDFERKDGDIHVLVVVPEGADIAVDPRGLLSVEEIRILRTSAELLQVMLPHALMECPTTISSRNPDFKANLCDFYDCYRRKKKWIQCMLLDTSFPASIVTGAHLFRLSNEYLSNCMMQISDIDDVRNGLLLFKPLEHAFDHFQISFIYDDHDDCFYLKLFDPSIGSTPLVDLMRDPNQIQVLMDAINRAKKPCKFDPQTTFGDLEGKPLKLDKLNRPYNRCLNLQARLAYTKAMKNQDIDPDYNFNDFWSEGWSLEDKMNMLQQSIENCDQI